MICFHNGHYLDEKDVKIPVDCPGFQYGFGVFTTLRTEEGKAIFLPEHINRLRVNSAKIALSFPDIAYQEIIQHLLVKNKQDNLKIKIIIYQEKNNQSGLLITASELKLWHSPIKLTIISKNYQANDFRDIKSLNYLENVLLHRKALQNGFDEGLLVNSQNLICECCYANIFFGKDGKIFTPKANNNILNGIMRQDFIKRNSVTERDISLAELTSFDHVFITNSVQGIVRVGSIDDLSFEDKR